MLLPPDDMNTTIQVFVDVTSRCKELLQQWHARVQGGSKAEGAAEGVTCTWDLRWHGHVHRSKDAVHSETRFRPMDLRADTQTSEVPACDVSLQGMGGGSARAATLRTTCTSDLLLMVSCCGLVRSPVSNASDNMSSSTRADSRCAGAHFPTAGDSSVLCEWGALDGRSGAWWHRRRVRQCGRGQECACRAE